MISKINHFDGTHVKYFTIVKNESKKKTKPKLLILIMRGEKWVGGGFGPPPIKIKKIFHLIVFQVYADFKI